MFDELIEFAELTIFTRINMILSEQISASSKCEKIGKLVLTFTEKNPGISRILAGDALWGENEDSRSESISYLIESKHKLGKFLEKTVMQMIII